jgi:hypothetical protein
MGKATINETVVAAEQRYSNFRINLLSTMLSIGEDARVLGIDDCSLELLAQAATDAFMLGSGYEGPSSLEETTDSNSIEEED